MENNNTSVPYIVYESEVARHERTVKRLVIALIVAIAMIVVSNLAWLWVFNQYDFTSESYTIENADGNTNYLEAGNDGEINNGIEGNSEEENSD